MTRHMLCLALGVLFTGCEGPGPPSSGHMSGDEEKVIEKTVRGVVQDFVAAWEEVTCENQNPILKFFDYSSPGIVYSDGVGVIVTEYEGDAWPQLIREAACSRTREELTLDSLRVRVLSRDVVSASWTFHATYHHETGPPDRAHGAVLQVFRQTEDGWKTQVAMDTHFPVAPE